MPFAMQELINDNYEYCAIGYVEQNITVRITICK